MRLFLSWWKRGAGIVAAEYLLLATIIGIALVVGCTTLTTALSVESGNPSLAVPASGQGGGESVPEQPDTNG